MPKYIDVSSVSIPKGFFEQDLNVPKLLNWLNNQPAADVAPVVHGRWIVTESIPTIEKTIECSACRCKGYYPKALWGAIRLTDYCPDCGAKMNLDET